LYVKRYTAANTSKIERTCHTEKLLLWLAFAQQNPFARGHGNQGSPVAGDELKHR
jgi:hypothetical protein